jgi:hypothetical protein
LQQRGRPGSYAGERRQRVPIGLRLSQTARTVSRAFDDAFEEAGGTLPVWLILLNPEDRDAIRPA